MPQGTPVAPGTAPQNPPQNPPAPATTKDVTINGEIFVLPTDEAERLIKARDAMTQSYNHTNSEREQLAKQLQDIEAAKAQAEAEKQKIDASSKGDIENLQKIHAQELQKAKDALAQVQRQNNEIRLRNIVSVRPDIPEVARADAAQLIQASVSEVIETNGVIHFKDGNGNLKEAGAYVSEWLQAHPAFKSVSVPAGPGARPGGDPIPDTKPTITLSEYTQKAGSDIQLVKDVSSGKIKLIQG